LQTLELYLFSLGILVFGDVVNHGQWKKGFVQIYLILLIDNGFYSLLRWESSFFKLVVEI